MNELHRNLSRIALPALCAALLPGCIVPDLPALDTATDGTGTADPDPTEGADSTGTPGDCTPLGPDDVSADATLPAGCYVVSVSLSIEHRLDLEPGVELLFEPLAGLSVFGTGVLSALGTDQAPILMSPTSDQGWLGLQWLGSASSSNRLQHVHLDAPSDTGASLSASSRLEVDACEFSGAPGFGLLADSGAELRVSATSFEGNGVPLALGIDQVGGVAADNTFTGNDAQIVQVEGGTLADAAQWAALPVPLQLTGNAYVEAALTMDPGLSVQMPQGSQFVVTTEGSLSAEGTAQDPITLRGIQDERGYWMGLSVASKASANVISHCVIEHGGAEGWNGSEESVAMVWLPAEAKLQVSHCTLRRSEGAALTSFGEADISGFADNTIEDNRQTLKVSPEMIGQIEASNSFVDNDEDYVRVGRPNANNAAIATPATWAALEVPYRVIDRFYVESDWTLAPGVTVQVMQDREIVVEPGGSLHASGTPRAPVAFVGAEALPGYWKGLLVLSASTNNELQHVQLRHAGSSGFNGNEDSDGALFVGGSINVSSAEVSDSGGHGLVVWSDGQLLGCSDVSFSNNTKSDVFVSEGGISACG